MSRLKFFARCAATLLPLLLLLGWGMQTVHFASHLAHHHAATRHYDSADDDWDGQCTQCRHADANSPTGAVPAFLLAATPVVVFSLPGRPMHRAGFTAAAYPPLAARPPPVCT